MVPVDALMHLADRLACPVCAGRLRLVERYLECDAGHRFDRARQGHVTLTAGTAVPTADTATMVQARERFHAAGHYRPLVQRLADLATSARTVSATAAGAGAGETGGERTHDRHSTATSFPTTSPRAPSSTTASTTGLILDAGTGTGQLLAHVLDDCTDAFGLGVDSSTYALRRAARAHQRAAAVGCDIWAGLPVRDGVVSVVLNVFAPRNGAEFRRVLRPDGLLLVVTPAPAHLHELRTALGLLEVDPHKSERMAAALGRFFHSCHVEELTVPLSLSHAEAATVIEMSPNAHHHDAEELRARIGQLPEPVSVTAAFTVSAYRPQ